LVQPHAVPIRFDRRKFFSAGDAARAEEFCALFHPYGYIYKPFAGDTWLSANEQWRLTHTEILKAIACEHRQCLLGARSGKTSQFAVLDIDAKSKHHSHYELHRLITHIMDAGLSEPVLYRSSHSEGWHLYLFFDRPLPTRELNKTLHQFLRNHGYTLQNGTLEVFPNPGGGNLGHGLRLPLQLGWAWLNPNTLEVIVDRAALNASEALDRFMSDLTDFSSTQSQYEEFKRAVSESTESLATVADMVQRATGKSAISHREIGDRLAIEPVQSVFGKLPPGIRPEIWWRGRDYFDNGLSGPGQRADALFCMGHYLFYGDPERALEALGYAYDQERRNAVESILAAKNHGQSKDLNRNRSDATAQIGRAARWLPPHKRQQEVQRYKKAIPLSWARHNGKLKADAMSRIKSAIESFVAAASPFKITELENAAGCSRSTLYAHKALWHQIYMELKNLPQKSSDEYNAVVGAAGLESSTPPTICVPDMPPGRLAARRVIRELTERIEKDRQNGQKYIESIFDRYAHSWKAKVLSAMPPDVDGAEAHELKACAPILLSLLAGAPDEEHQIWLQKQLQIIRDRLDELRKSWAQTRVQALELSG
jgi:hypothetical protein